MKIIHELRIHSTVVRRVAKNKRTAGPVKSLFQPYFFFKNEK